MSKVKTFWTSFMKPDPKIYMSHFYPCESLIIVRIIYGTQFGFFKGLLYDLPKENCFFFRIGYKKGYDLGFHVLSRG